MASGHANRANRPNTWLHRPNLRREDSPCELGRSLRHNPRQELEVSGPTVPAARPRSYDVSNALTRSTNLLSALSVDDQPSRLLRIYAALAGAVVAYPWLLAGFY